MKQALLLLSMLFVFGSLDAQTTELRKTKFHEFVFQVNEISHSKLPMSLKENRLLNLIGQYIGNHQSSDAEKTLSDYTSCLKDGKTCDKQKVIGYIAKMKKMKKKIITKAELKTMGDFENDMDLQMAYTIYETVGSANIPETTYCKNKNCDLDGQLIPKSRGAKEHYWRYAGERKYFLNSDMVGYRYLCVKVEKKDDAGSINDAFNTDPRVGNDSTGTDANSGGAYQVTQEYAWKSEENVDLWEGDQIR